MLDRVSALPRPEPAAAARSGGRATFARVAVAYDLATVRRDWEGLLERTPCSAYQTPGWLAAWLPTAGRRTRPVFGLAFDQEGTCVALLPLGLTRHGGLRVARFLGGHDINTGLGLFDPAVPFDAPALRRLLCEVARVAGIDLYVLANQPAAWAGAANPLAALPHDPSPSAQHETDLTADPEAFLTRTLSGRARKHIRQKEAKLAGLGPVRHLEASTPEDVARIAATLAAQRAARYGADAAALSAFVRTGATGAAAPVELHALLCGDAVLATFAGALYGGHLSGMLISMTADPHWSRFSPGELLLARVMARHCVAGTTSFDLGVGEARYKASFCPRVVPLFDVVLGATWRGRVAAQAWRVVLAGKRRLKRSPWLMAAAARLQRRASSRHGAAAD